MSEAENRTQVNDNVALFKVELSKKQKELEELLSREVNLDLSQLDGLSRISTLALTEIDLCKKSAKITKEQRGILALPVTFTFDGLEEGDPEKMRESLLQNRECSVIAINQLSILYQLVANVYEKMALRNYINFGMGTASLTAYTKPAEESGDSDEPGMENGGASSEATADDTVEDDITSEENAGGDATSGEAAGASGLREEGDADTQSSTETTPTSEKNSEEKNADDPDKDNAGNGAGSGKKPEKKEKGTPRRRSGCFDEQEAELPTLTIRVPFPDEEKERLGIVRSKVFPEHAWDSMTKIMIIPAQIYRVNYAFEKLVDKDTNKIYSAKSCCEISRDYNKSRLSYDLVSEIMYQRYVNILSGTQLTWDLASMRYKIERQKIYLTVMARATDTFRWVRRRMLQLALMRLMLQCDETYMQDLDAPGKKRYMWLIRTSELSEGPQIIVFIYGPGRDESVLENKIFKEFIANFREGDPPMWIICDAYEAYRELERNHPGMFVVCACMSHMRGKFVDVLKTIAGFKMWDEDKKMNESAAYQGVCIIREIFMDERERKDLTAEERKLSRQDTMKKQLDEFYEWLDQFVPNETHLKGGLLDIAINYAKNQEPYLRKVLENGEIPISNNGAEREIIHAARFRDMSKQFGSEKGGDVNGICLTIATTAQENGADLRIYFKYLMMKVPELLKAHGIDPKAKEIDPNVDYSFLDKVMPWSDDYKEFEKDERAKRFEMTLEIARMFPEYAI